MFAQIRSRASRTITSLWETEVPVHEEVGGFEIHNTATSLAGRL